MLAQDKTSVYLNDGDIGNVIMKSNDSPYLLIRTCTKCLASKSFEEFNNRKNGKYGKASICKVCYNKHHNDYMTNEYQNPYEEGIRDRRQIKEKECSTCRISKEVSAYFRRKDTSDGFAYICKSCQKDYLSDYRADKDLTVYQLSSRLRNAVYVRDYKLIPCADCGVNYERFCMDCDHLFDKEHNISSMINRGFSIKHIDEELSKTEIVCVLCHRDRTYKRMRERYPSVAPNINRDLIIMEKDKPCVICNIKYEHWKMDFDHLLGINKLFKISSFIGSRRNYTKRIREEIAKCQVLCALCHRRKTFMEQKTYEF